MNIRSLFYALNISQRSGSALAAIICLLAAPAAKAATDLWVGNTDNTWSNAANWTANAVPGTDDVLQFGLAGSSGTTLSNTITGGTFGGITFLSGASAYTITGNSFAFDSISGDSISNLSTSNQALNLPITVLAGSHSIVTGASTGTLTLGGPITMNPGVTVVFTSTAAGAGSIILSSGVNTNGILGGNQFYGTTDYASVNGSGIVTAGPQGGYTSIAAGALTSGASTNYEFTSDTGNLTSANGTLINTLLAANNSGSTRTLTVTGTLGLGSNGGIFVSSGATKSFTVSSGTLTANGGGQITLADAEGGFAGTTQNLLVSSNIVNSDANAVSVATEGTVNLSGSSSFTGGLYVDSGEAITPNSGGANAFGPNGGNVYVANGATAVFAATGGVTYAQNFVINGAGDNGAGALRFNPNSQGNNQTVTGTITLTGSSNITLGANSSSVITLSGQVTGAGGLKIAPNTNNHLSAIEFSNSSNNWTGGLLLNSDGDTMTVDIGANNAIPDGSVNINGSGAGNGEVLLNLNGFNDTVDGLGSGGSSTNAIVDNTAGSTTSTLTIGGNGGSGSFGGIIQNSGASAVINIIKTGTGTETFTGANTYAGTTTVTSGTLAIGLGTAGTFGNGSGALSIGGGVADLGATSQTVGAVTITAGNGTIQDGSLTGASYLVSNPSGTATVSANLLGSAGVTMSGSGALTLSGNNGYAGVTAVNAGTVFLNTAGTNNIANSSAITVSKGATLDVTQVTGTFTLAGSQSLTNNGTVNGPVTLSGAQVFTNNGAAGDAVAEAGILAGSGTYGGTVTVSGGVLAPGAFNTVGSVTVGNLVVTSGALDVAFSGATSTALALTGSASFAGDGSLAIVQLTSPTLASYTIFNAPGGITGLTAGLLETLGRTTYSIDAGKLSANILQIDVGGGADNLTWGTSGATGNEVTWENQQVQKNWTNLTNANAADYFYDGDNVTFNDNNFGHYTVAVSGTVSPGSVMVSSTGAYTINGGTIAGSGMLTKNNSGSLTLSGANTYNGGTTLNAGTLNINSATAIGVGTLTINGGTIDNTSGLTIALASNNAQTWAGSFTFGGSNPLDLGSGAVTISGSASPTITIAGQTLTIDGVIGGSAGITLAGPGTLALTGTSTYTGPTTVNSAVLDITGALGNTAVTVNSNGTLNLENAGAINQNTLTLEGGAFTESVNNALGGTAALWINGSSVTLLESNNFSGNTTVTSGTLSLQIAGAISGGATLNGGTLLLGASGAMGSGVLALDSGSLDNTTGAPLALTNATTWNGNWTFLGSNNLTFGGGATLAGNSGVTINNGAQLIQSGLVGDGGHGYGITLGGSGAMILSNGANSFRGNIVVNGGTLTGTVNGSVTSGPFGDGQVAGRTITVNSGGTLVFASNNAFGSGAGVVVSALPAFTANGGAVVGNGYDVIGNVILENGGSLVAGPQTASGIVGSYEAFELAGTVTGTGSTPSTMSSGAAGVGFNLGPNTVFNVANITSGSADLTVTAPLFNQSNDYAGAAGALTKSGAGELLLNSGGASLYAGVTTINGGTLSVDSLAFGGAASDIGASSNAASNLIINGGTLQYLGIGSTTDRGFTIGTNNATIDASGSGPLAISGLSGIAYSTPGQAQTLTLTGANSGANTMGDVLSDNGIGSLSVIKSGTGLWTLSAADTYTGATTVTAGTLDVTGTLADSASVTVTNATLEGAGFIANSVTIGSGTGVGGSAILEPGAAGAVGTLTTGTTVSLLADGAFVFNLDSTGGGAGNGASELFALSVNLNAASEFDFNDISSNPGALTIGDQFTVISTTDGLFGSFANLPNGDIFTVGPNTYQASYSGDDLTLSVAPVPEPETWGLLAAGVGMLIGIQKLRKRRIGA